MFARYGFHLITTAAIVLGAVLVSRTIAALTKVLGNLPI